ncbi:hypothetical protein USDA257_c58830 [Sinorhizobium fredii USDA 257]|uniref:Uncharacterized protein n=1 Tax=Sinorhizobium fredii (strain USDA 257) TaxID=1185652 RepID=I3XET8_SINF2|nr:hypothetical protein USDA257_c58830 [Sinorhizobium fredii USDA 257]
MRTPRFNQSRRRSQVPTQGLRVFVLVSAIPCRLPLFLCIATKTPPAFWGMLRSEIILLIY